MHFAKLIKLIFMLVQLPVYYFAYKKKKETFKTFRFKSIKKKRFIYYKKLYRFTCIGVFPLFNNISAFYIGIYQQQKIGLFTYNFLNFITSFRSSVVTINIEDKMPKFLIRPRNFAYSLLKGFSRKREVVVYHRTFNKSYVILADNQDQFLVAKIMPQQLLDFFANHLDTWLESDGRHLLVFNEKELIFDGSLLDDMLDKAILIKSFFKQPKPEHPKSSSQKALLHLPSAALDNIISNDLP